MVEREKGLQAIGLGPMCRASDAGRYSRSYNDWTNWRGNREKWIEKERENRVDAWNCAISTKCLRRTFTYVELALHPGSGSTVLKLSQDFNPYQNQSISIKMFTGLSLPPLLPLSISLSTNRWCILLHVFSTRCILPICCQQRGRRRSYRR